MLAGIGIGRPPGRGGHPRAGLSGIIYVGTLPLAAADRLHRLGDPSYGMYLSGFVIQQVLVWVGLVHVHQPWLSFLEGAVLATAFGYASWHLVEKRAMRLVKPRPDEPAPPQPRPGRRATVQPRSSSPSSRWPIRSRLVRR